jgi:hypothetical protein
MDNNTCVNISLNKNSVYKTTPIEEALEAYKNMNFKENDIRNLLKGLCDILQVYMLNIREIKACDVVYKILKDVDLEESKDPSMKQQTESNKNKLFHDAWEVKKKLVDHLLKNDLTKK